MLGSIRKRYPNSNSWSVVIYLGKDPDTGKKRYQWITVKGNKHEAEKKLRELILQHETGLTIKPDKITCRDYLERWLRDYVKINLTSRSFERYRDLVNDHLIPDFGAILLTQLRPEHLQKHYARIMEAGLSIGTVHYHHHVIHKALQTAIEWGLLSRNVADAVKPPRLVRQEMQTWDEDEVKRFLETASPTPHYAFFYTVLFTGMRKSELAGLQWQDVDLLGLQLAVNRSAHYLKDGSVQIKDVKSAKSRRSIAISPSLALVLKELWDTEHPGNQDFVFKRSDGRPVHPNTITGAWQSIIKKAGLKMIRFHDARHTHATLMLKQGVHPKIVQERLGHSTISMTLDTYSHVVPGLQESAAINFDTLINPGLNQPGGLANRKAIRRENSED